MNERIENESLSVEIAYHGAELQSLYSKTQNKEFLWQGDAKWWPRKAPVLFPIVGKLKNNSYKIGDNTYSLPQHGFARDKEFVVAEKSDCSVTFRLSHDEETLKVYPFQFDLYIKYEITGSRLSITYEILNTGKDEMLFSIGAHPGFICPLNENENFNDYYLEFEKSETLDRYLLDEGNFNGLTETVMTDSRTLQLNEELFKKDAIVFKNMKSSFIDLKSKSSQGKLRFGYKDFPYFGIWTKPGAPFICLEPWCGIADNISFASELKDKEGINTLKPSEIFTRNYFVEA